MTPPTQPVEDEYEWKTVTHVTLERSVDWNNVTKQVAGRIGLAFGLNALEEEGVLRYGSDAFGKDALSRMFPTIKTTPTYTIERVRVLKNPGHK